MHPEDFKDDLLELFHMSLDMLCVGSPDGRFLLVSPSLSELLGLETEELLGRPFIDFVHPEDRERALQEAGRLAEGDVTRSFESRFVTTTGDVRWLQWNARADPAKERIYATARDVTEQHIASERLGRYAASLETAQVELKEALRELDRLASRDALTQLLNRRAFELRGAEELATAREADASIALALFDIDHFKQINDCYGHLTGDAVLREVAARMGPVCRGEDHVARWGGDEFAILFPGLSLDEARIAAERIALAVRYWPVVVGSASVPVHLSGGVAAARGAEIGDVCQLVEAADAALMEAKHCGRNRTEAASLPTKVREAAA
jgi:diguanylate cyclase (GGDEF)-like protein/PAS domain S-box-containing protein